MVSTHRFRGECIPNEARESPNRGANVYARPFDFRRSGFFISSRQVDEIGQNSEKQQPADQISPESH